MYNKILLMEFKLCVILSLCQVGRYQTDSPSTVYRDVQGFGPGCRYRCNCNTQLCNNVTGQCQDGCKSGWMGPSCQYRNTASLILSTSQFPTEPAGASSEHAFVAIDGSVVTCSRTGQDVNQTGQKYWQADLKEKTYIVGFVIKINQADIGRFRGFLIQVGNSTTTLQTCYLHKDETDGELIMDVNCEQPVVGNVIRISLAENETSALVLCEVEIYGGRLISFNKPVSIQSTLDYQGLWFASYAVDGRHPLPGEDQDVATVRTCAATIYGQTNPNNKWWLVNFTNVYSIIAVDFYGRFVAKDQFDRFLVKTGLDVNSLQIIFSDDPASDNINSYNPRSKKLTWPVDGSHVRVERINAIILVVCELEVFADCSFGWCGWECDKICMCSHPTTGKHKIEGTCPHGCAGRWIGLNNRCDTECPETKWGPFCNKTCGHCDEYDKCSVVTGLCPGSCSPGWTPSQCTEVCSNGTFGKNCTSACGNCKEDTNCDTVTGHCKSGCQPGYSQPFCTEICEPGLYGDNCNQSCGSCLNGIACNPHNGSCSTGCVAGFSGNLCKTPCDVRHYGPDCMGVCGDCDIMTNCHRETGECLNGCLPGRIGVFCKDVCPDGFYGLSCYLKCGHCKDDKPCDPATGRCELCAAGFTGEFCTTICSEGRYGEGCVHSCGHCADTASCNRTTGFCPMGCISEFTGIRCSEGIQTTLSTGAVVGIVVGVIIPIATVIIISILYKWRTLNALKKNQENVYTTPSVSAIKHDNDIYDAIGDSVSASTAGSEHACE